LVGKHHVLTAAHNIFDPRKGGWAKDVKVFPAYNQGRAQYGVSRAVKLISMSGYTENRDADYDLGFVITKDDIGLATGMFQMAPADGQDLRSAKLQLVGYPSEGDYDGETLQNTPCKVTRTTDLKVFYKTNTYEGMSGAPIFVQYQLYGQAEPAGVVVGIHTSGNETENSGPMLRNEITHWVAKALDTSNSTIAGLWLLDGNTLRITLNGSQVMAVYEKVLDPYGPIKPGHVEFQGLIDGKTIVGRDTIFYLNSPVNIQCRIAGSTVEVNIVLNISQDEQTMTARVQAWAPDAYCRLFLVNQDLTFTKIGNSR
jgi:V8-like Glu-specific endopeptidase